MWVVINSSPPETCTWCSLQISTLMRWREMQTPSSNNSRHWLATVLTSKLWWLKRVSICPPLHRTCSAKMGSSTVWLKKKPRNSTRHSAKSKTDYVFVYIWHIQSLSFINIYSVHISWLIISIFIFVTIRFFVSQFGAVRNLYGIFALNRTLMWLTLSLLIRFII